ncbi:Glucan 1,3-beta-glucosidase [Cladobotryum mycophilum]|uniref:Glucan 1,3-beta-glucosidase n=1 Tax=Cladobotryum mycophilum TaxID=491253 RepID=A0ABR0SCM9_9HYPO
MMGLSTIVTASLLALRLFSQEVAAAPAPGISLDVKVDVVKSAAATSWWLPNIQRQGVVPYGANAGYKIYRNVKDYGAKGDGVTDDTDAINRAIADGARCGLGCDSTTTYPALVYIPPGTYVVSSPIVLYYYTHLIGDVTSIPTLKASSNFAGIAVLDSDPYIAGGANWYFNTNNFFRHVRNLKIDLTAQPISTGTGIHWQVAQATSLQNIEFFMSRDTSANNKQQGIFMDNGSGGFMTDLTFHGGALGMFLGNQQFTTRNLIFDGCQTAIYMNWNWVWTFHGLSISNANIGIDMTAGDVQNVGSIVVLDSKFTNTKVGVLTRYQTNQGWTNSTLVLDNVDMTSNTPIAVKNSNGATVLNGNTNIASFVQGRSYTGNSGRAVQASQPAVAKPAALLDGSGRIVTKSKPQYNGVDASKFVSVKSKGAKGDGRTDDTAAIQAVFNTIGADQVVYFDHGAYVITDTVKVPKNVKIVGEVWPLIMAGGTKFKDQNNPKPVWQVGQPGDVGNVEIQDLIFETLGPQPGAILMEFNVAGATKGSAGLFDVHFRIGGSAGTQLQSNTCSKNPNSTGPPNPNCFGAFMLLHLTPSASAYLENVWAWVADHELDLGDHNQVNIYNGRGILFESTKGTWGWGTASEHNVLVNYNINKASNIFLALVQTETAYFQGNPDAKVPFTSNPTYGDPDFSKCTGPTCARTWGLRVINSSNILVYGGGLYSFFDNYAQPCVDANNCQQNMIDVQNSQVRFFGVSTKASVNVITLNGAPAALDKDNRNNFCAAIASFTAS